MWTRLLFLGCFAAVFGNRERDFRVIDSIYDEPNCLETGGRCVIYKDCPQDRRTTTFGLCPAQQDRGVECCYGTSIRESRCKKHGGECEPGTWRCPLKLQYAAATDCAEGEKCCILVR